MTHKDFELIARVLKQSTEMAVESERKGVVLVAWELSTALATTNERFDADRFLRAAGVR